MQLANHQVITSCSILVSGYGQRGFKMHSQKPKSHFYIQTLRCTFLTERADISQESKRASNWDFPNQQLMSSIAACWAYLVQKASSSDAPGWDTGRCSSIPGQCRCPGAFCSRACRSSRSCLQDNPTTVRCRTRAGRRSRLTACTRSQMTSTEQK